MRFVLGAGRAVILLSLSRLTESFCHSARTFGRGRSFLLAEEQSLSNFETLTFTGTFSHASDIIPLKEKADLAAFLASKEAKTSLISVGGKRAAQQQELTPELLELWKETCANFYGEASLPEEGDEVVACESIIQFPGLKISTTVYSGTKLSLSKDGIPEHEFLLIAEKQRAEGPAPLVWVYKKLTGVENDSSDSFSRSKGHAISRVTIVEKDGGVALLFNVNIQILIKFPRILVKILPTSKEKMEEQGSASVLKAISKDIVDAVTATRDAYLCQVDAVPIADV